jgi:hypothetical protein
MQNAMPNFIAGVTPQMVPAMIPYLYPIWQQGGMQAMQGVPNPQMQGYPVMQQNGQIVILGPGRNNRLAAYSASRQWQTC